MTRSLNRSLRERLVRATPFAALRTFCCWVIGSRVALALHNRLAYSHACLTAMVAVILVYAPGHEVRNKFVAVRSTREASYGRNRLQRLLEGNQQRLGRPIFQFRLTADALQGVV